MDWVLKLLNRVRKIELDKLTPLQIGVGILGVIVALWMLAQLVSLALALLPIVIAGVAVVLIFQWLTSDSDDISEEVTKSRAQRTVEQALATVFGNKDDEQASSKTGTVTVQREAEKSVETVTPPPVERIAQIEEEASAELDPIAPIKAVEDDKLVIKQVVNPETGFKEPDISRLIEQEEKKLAEADRVTEDIMAQIEARRKRLLGNEEDS